MTRIRVTALRLLCFAVVLPVIVFGQTPNSPTLTASPNPSNYGQAVTLTATFTSGATGKVTFYDGVTMLGVGTIFGTQAALTTVMLASGNRKLWAYYGGDGTHGGGFSAGLAQTVVAGASLAFRHAVSYTTSSVAVSMTVGDFNGDGKQDFVTTNGANGVSVFLGNGDGTFQPGVTIPTGSTQSVTVGDFNGDGRMDLTVANRYTSTVSVLLGNGDGTFQTAVNYPAGSASYAVAVGDFNGDGKADLVVANNSGTNVSVLIGNGDGTFRTAVDYSAGAAQISVAVGDFNGDGKTDIVVGTYSGVSVLLGNGDGTFAAGVNYVAGTYTYAVVVADFNGDGKADLVTASSFGISVLLGNGDGTFGTVMNYGSGSSVYAVVVADFDGDGVSDIAATNYYNGDAVDVLLGNGDGTFKSAVYYPVGQYPYGVAVGDFNGDGKADVIVGSASTPGFSVLLGGGLPDLAITVSHGGGLTQGQNGATYSVVVSNAAGAGATSGTVTVTETVPTGMTLASMAGTGWTCPGTAANNCTRGDALAAGASYPVIKVSVNVAAGASSPQVNQVSVSGGGSGTAYANDSTTILAAFSDTSATDFFFDAVNLMREYGITAGCGASTYCPNDNVTRAQMAIFVVRSVLGGDNFTYSSTPYFNDVPSGAFGFQWIQKMWELGITAGCGAGTYCPNDPVTRGQMAIFVIRARLGVSADSTFTYPATAYFTDVPASYPYFKWIQRMRLDQITAGCGVGTYCPDDSVTRGQMAIFIMRGSFNLLLPAGTPALASSTPAIAPIGQATTVTLTGVSTNFVQGTTVVTAGAGITVGTVTVTNATTLSVTLTVAGNAAAGPRTLVATTGSEQAVLPNGVVVQ